jgi:hypothetical protein
LFFEDDKRAESGEEKEKAVVRGSLGRGGGGRRKGGGGRSKWGFDEEIADASKKR